MEWAWLAPALSFAAFGLIVLAGRYLPGKGSFLAILAIAGGFGVFWYVLVDFLDRGTDAFSVTWFELGDITFNWGITIDPLAVVMLGLVSLVALLIQVLLGGLHGGTAPVRVVLRRPRPVRRSDACAGAGGQLAAALYGRGSWWGWAPTC